jgi:glycosyltransferase involved in cell wall biosynthesis/SAM-dependent methyltransferase
MAAPVARPGAPLGINVAGFLRGGLGLGEAGRLYVAALRAAGVPVRTTTIDPRLPDTVGPSGRLATAKTTDFTDLETDAETPFNLVCVNAPELPQFYRDVGPAFFDGKRTIGVWAWEVDKVPSDWEYAFELVDEIWVYSRYVEEILRSASDVPVVRVPLPVIRREETAVAPPDLGLGAGFTFLFLFDFYSTMARKNPLGLIEAFTRAFEPGEGPQLLLKSFNGDYKPARLAAVERAAARHPDVHVVDRYLASAEKDALMAGCDCYVSLHRSEGFGLTLAEAMALGKPVIATGYSGNTDFMSEANSYLVRHELTEVGPEGENYPPDGHWAEPDLGHAAELMRRVWGDREEASARAARGRSDVLAELSLERVGAIARGRLDELTRAGLARPRSGRRRPPPPPAGLAPLRHAELTAERDPLANAQELGGAKGLWRQGALRAMRPFTAHQDEFNVKSIEALREVADRLAELHRLLAHLGSDATLEQDSYDLSRMLAGMRARPASSHPAISLRDQAGRVVLGFDAATDHGADPVGFEDVFRGSEELIRERQLVYADVLGSPAAVLDLGCGRGEFLDVLRERGIACRGVELSEQLVAHCRGKGHDVELADALEHLRGLDDAGVPAIFAAQVVEHLPADVLRELLTLTEAKLEPGGTAIFETVNPHTPSALKAFWTDPTHHHPLYPEVLIALCRFAGFASGRVVFPEPSGDFNEDVYDSPDYAVVVTKRGSA